ncbi:MAG TPA: hypothetical protein VFC42_07610 [Methylomirabilota bacterium]|nr:hypothetical protein [Methylomirabilota bacterium]
MPRILHLIKDPARRTAFEVLAAQARDPANRLAVVLLQAAAGVTAPLPGEVFRLGDGAGSPYPPIDHSRLLELIFAADTVVAW